MYTWIIVLGVIVLGILLYATRDESKTLKRETPLETLNRRYVKGEIKRAEYEKQKRIINSKD